LQRVELELGYAPTTIELPVDDEEAAHERAGGDETRVRSVPEVRAQPAAPAAPPVAAPPPDARPAVEALQPASRRRILITALIGVLAVLSILAVVLALVIGGGVRPGSTPSPSATGGSAIIGPSVPQATNGVATPSADGTSVDFSWTNPHPKTGDVSYWARAETPADRRATSTPTATVTGVVPGSKVCINVEIGRSGATGDPLVICTG
jgi:hypothetical protein